MTVHITVRASAAPLHDVHSGNLIANPLRGKPVERRPSAGAGYAAISDVFARKQSACLVLLCDQAYNEPVDNDAQRVRVDLKGRQT